MYPQWPQYRMMPPGYNSDTFGVILAFNGTKKVSKFVGHHCKIFKKLFFPLSPYVIYHFEAFFKQNAMGLFKNWC